MANRRRWKHGMRHFILAIHRHSECQGKSTGTLTFNSGCGLSTTTESFDILSLKQDGSGTAGLTCGSSCGWTFNIQGNRAKLVINLVDITDPNNWLAGTAIRQFAH